MQATSTQKIELPQNESMVAIEIAAHYGHSEGQTLIEIGRIHSTGFFVGSTRNLRNGVSSKKKNESAQMNSASSRAKAEGSTFEDPKVDMIPADKQEPRFRASITFRCGPGSSGTNTIFFFTFKTFKQKKKAPSTTQVLFFVWSPPNDAVHFTNSRRCQSNPVPHVLCFCIEVV